MHSVFSLLFVPFVGNFYFEQQKVGYFLSSMMLEVEIDNNDEMLLSKRVKVIPLML